MALPFGTGFCDNALDETADATGLLENGTENAPLKGSQFSALRGSNECVSP